MTEGVVVTSPWVLLVFAGPLLIFVGALVVAGTVRAVRWMRHRNPNG